MNARNLLCVAALSIPAMSQAHFLWVSLDPAAKTASIGFQEVPEQAPLPLGAKAAQIKAWLPTGKQLPMKADQTWLRAPSTAACVAASLDYGVIDRRDAGRGVFWLKYYAKAAVNLAASQTRFNLPVELTAIENADGAPVVTVWQNGKPAPEAEVVVEDMDAKPTFEGKTASDGTVVLPKAQGPLEVRALITDNTPGAQDGKSYELTRSYSTLRITDPSAKSLTRQLRDSFGDMHDVVSHTAFINSVMDSKVTKAQLEQHLQQRALIHESMDAILRRAPLEPGLYGPDQREVLTLLKSNVQQLGFRWPHSSDAMPLTKAFLAEIEASKKQGPYFALGVFHVYYGGITHGGRDIGAMIDQTLGTTLPYYEKSDGYEPYAKAVDTIVDLTAQEEMIRGADEAYRYIIAVNNLDTFKS